jgi:two-component system LytT family sensor kinase
LRNLRAQLSPHFLFNVLNSISMLVRAGRETEALDTIDAFAGLLRGFLRERPSEFVELSDELVFVERYLHIQRTRFADRLSVTIDAASATNRLWVPAFVMYPLVENAIQHGLSKQEGKGHISVRTRVEGERLVLEVEDDGPGLAPANAHVNNGNGMGLDNLRARLANLYKDDASLELRPGSSRGMVARIHLPNCVAAPA